MATPDRPLHPFIRPPEEYEVVQAPVRDDEALGPTEDLDRQPDGMPHEVIGLTAFFSVVLAMLIAALIITGGAVGYVAAAILALLGIPTLVSTLREKAARERDHVHPSR